MPPTKTRWQLHVEEWTDCQRCELKDSRSRVVLGRGQLPCDVVFVGEAPWKDEDSLGDPFVGRAGHKLDEIIEDAFGNFATRPTHALTNLVGCKPPGDDEGKPTKPDVASIKACAPRLQDFVAMANPKLIVCVGRMADDYTTPYMKDATKFSKAIPRIAIVHPAWILRLKTAKIGSEMRKASIAIRDGVARYVVGGYARTPPELHEEDIPF